MTRVKVEIIVNSENLLEKNWGSYNSYYKLYRAEYCKKTGLPMYSRKDFEYLEQNKIFTRTRAKKEKVEIDETKPVGWYRMQTGYAPLFSEKLEAK